MLNRDSIRDGVVYKLLKKNQHITKTIPQTPEERSESLKNTLKKDPLIPQEKVFGFLPTDHSYGILPFYM